MNKKGFAISSVIYAILILFLALVAGILGLLGNRKLILDKLKNDVMSKLNNTEVAGNLYKDNSGANIPELYDGMIPVVYKDGNWVYADIYSKWYDYDNQEWANAVILSESGKRKSVGQSLDINNDILAMFVWVPRYDYKIGDKEREILVNFISKLTQKETEGYILHPSFTFGSETLSGIWVGKFETSHIDLSSSTKDNNLGCVDENCTSADKLRILPNKTSLRYNNVSNFFYASRSMSRANNPFGINKTTTNTHMMKDSEWGAVAYLSQSRYGKYGNGGEEIYINNCAITGMAGNSVSEGKACDTNTYETDKGQKASTTGNIYGIYDMSGGVNDYVMGVLADSNGQPLSGTDATDNSGFNGTLYSGDSKEDGVFLPSDSKYYDLYAANSNSSSVGTIGHALGETREWYGDYAVFVTKERPWFIRGGSSGDGTYAGIFRYNSHSGAAHGSISFRIVLTSES